MPLVKLSYENTASLTGSPSATAAYRCERNDWISHRASLLGSTDEEDAGLKCLTVHTKPLGGDVHCGMMELTASFGPAPKADEKTVDAPFKFRVEVGGESVTIAGKGYHWPDGTTLDDTQANNILPTKHFTLFKLVLFGTRSRVNLDWLATYADAINSDEFLGAAAETVFFETAGVTERTDKDGATVYDVELHLMVRPSGWNKFFREGCAVNVEPMQIVYQGAGNVTKVYSNAVEFANLLTWQSPPPPESP